HEMDVNNRCKKCNWKDWHAVADYHRQLSREAMAQIGGSSQLETDWKAEAERLAKLLDKSSDSRMDLSEKLDAARDERNTLREKLAEIEKSGMTVATKAETAICEVLTRLCARAQEFRDKAQAANLFDQERVKYGYAAKVIDKLIEEMKNL